MYFAGREAKMADFTSSPQGGGYGHEYMQHGVAEDRSNTLTTLTNTAGAVVSLALIVGIGMWGYDLVMRDVSGVPVVRAAEGEMRVRPVEPGGELAQNQGLSVNRVASEGTAGARADQVRLATEQVGLAEEDQPISREMVATAQQADTPAAPEPRAIPDAAAAIQSGNVDDLVAQLTEGVAPLEEVTASAGETVVATVTEEVVETLRDTQAQANAALLSAPGVRASLRPQHRPKTIPALTNASLVSATPNTGVEDVDPTAIPAGTRLVQLGAYDSADIARDQWGKLEGRFGEYMRGKDRVIQKASSGGREFYRLRVMGFADLGEARRFCSTFVAGKAECIPVVTR
jgi:hypothetical protein